MHADRIDAVARSLATGASRRGVVGAVIGGLLMSRMPRLRAQTPAAGTPAATPPVPVAATPVALSTVCTNPDRGGLQDRAPGELAAYEELTGEQIVGMPPGARAWRVVYVSTGRDNTERTLVCGVVVAPAAGPTVVTDPAGVRRGQVVTWGHGTRGLVPRCLAAANPAADIFGPTPTGLNLVAWSATANGDGPQSTVADGILAGMVDAGWIVTATDYYADLWGGNTLMPFIIGKIEAANGIDIVRAAHHLLREVGLDQDAAAYDVVTWGHSQGGHAALWMGQLLEPYAGATATADDPTLSLAGVALEAPASVLITQPGDPDTSPGAGLFDWTLPAEAPEIGDQEAIALIFSYVFAAWASYAEGAPPAADAMPAFPPTPSGLDLAAVTTPAASEVVAPIAELCWADTALVTPLVTTPFLAPEVANGPVIDGLTHGNFDRLCAGAPSPAMAAWCEWSRYHTPGPRGTSPLPTLPRRGDALAPVLIAAGSNDVVVHCVAPAAAPAAVPSGSDCVPAALYAALAVDYCPNGATGDAAAGHLALNIWRAEPGVTQAGHEDIAGLLATENLTAPRFVDSPLQRFIAAAFAGSLAPGCAATVMNSVESD